MIMHNHRPSGVEIDSAVCLGYGLAGSEASGRNLLIIIRDEWSRSEDWGEGLVGASERINRI